MSGPVWKRLEGADQRCALCLGEVNEGFVEGHVVNAEFRPQRTLCESCYSQHNWILQKSPPLIAAFEVGVEAAVVSDNRS